MLDRIHRTLSLTGFVVCIDALVWAFDEPQIGGWYLVFGGVLLVVGAVFRLAAIDAVEKEQGRIEVI